MWIGHLLRTESCQRSRGCADQVQEVIGFPENLILALCFNFCRLEALRPTCSRLSSVFIVSVIFIINIKSHHTTQKCINKEPMDVLSIFWNPWNVQLNQTPVKRLRCGCIVHFYFERTTIRKLNYANTGS